MTISFAVSASSVVAVLRAPMFALSNVVAEIIRDQMSLKAKDYTRLLANASAVHRAGTQEQFDALNGPQQVALIESCQSSAKVYAEKGLKVAVVSSDHGLNVGEVIAAETVQDAAMMVRAWFNVMHIETITEVTAWLGMSSGRSPKAPKEVAVTPAVTAQHVIPDATRGAFTDPAAQAERIMQMLAAMGKHQGQNTAYLLMTECAKFLGVDVGGAADAVLDQFAAEAVNEVAASGANEAIKAASAAASAQRKARSAVEVA